MKKDPVSPVAGKKIITAGVILLFCLFASYVTALAYDSILNLPPQAPPQPVEASQDGISAPEYRRDTASPTKFSEMVYLPLIQQGKSGLFINTQERQVALNYYIERYLSSEGTAINWTGSHSNCNPGSTGQNFRDAVLQRINYFRAMAGVPAGVAFSEESNRKAQAAALMMSVNRKLSHDPTTDWLCYSTDGDAGAGSSNLYLGVYGWNAITGYMKDPGTGNSFVGHRRWILYPQTQVMGTGDIPPTTSYSPANALLVFDEAHMWGIRPPTRDEFVAWPPPGYVPYQVVFPKWSFSYPAGDFIQATVTMSSNGVNLPLTKYTVVNGYGENTLVWMPNFISDGAVWPKPNNDTRYDVSVKNVLINGVQREFTYTVIVFDPTP
jgi:uncharacterized protein YkwD